MKYYYKTKNDVMSASLEDKIDTLLYVNAKACEQSLKNIIRSKNSSIEDVKERNIKIGPLVSGEAYYHEMNHYYDVIGFLVESECQFNGARTKTYGFRSIYFGKCHECAPVDFDDGYSLEPYGQIGNGLGDHVEILDVLESDEDVQKCINKNNIDINKYLKDLGLCLAEKSHKEKEVAHSDMEV